MMAEDWDLFAIVRSCQSATNTTATTKNPFTITTTTTNTTPLPRSISTGTVKEEELEYKAFSFPNIVHPITNEIQELNQLFTSFIPTITTTTTTSSGRGANPNSPDFDFAAACFGQQQPTTPISICSHFVPQPQAASTSSLNRFPDQQLQQQQNQKQEFQVPQSNNSATVLQNQQPQTPRSRKMKSQQGKMVCHVTADILSADLWAWRKYGQKPIRGSPYPRNYYRCSSSKGCTARKQVEQSNTEAHMFIVTYTGDHTHPRPTHRNSLAGSTRNKSLAFHPPTSISFQPNTTTSSSSAPNMLENRLAHDRSGPDPNPEMESDEEISEGDAHIHE